MCSWKNSVSAQWNEMDACTVWSGQICCNGAESLEENTSLQF